MNSNIFERKSFLEENWLSGDISNHFIRQYSDGNLVLKINLKRAGSNEADLFKKYLIKNPIKDIKKVVLDFSTCSFIDSTFMSIIINLKKQSKFEINLVVSNKRQLTLLKITRFNALFKIYSDLDQALD